MSKKNKKHSAFRKISVSAKQSTETLPKRVVEVVEPSKVSSDGKNFEWCFSRKYSHLKNKKYGWSNADLQKLLFEILKTFLTHQKRRWVDIRQNAKKYHFHELNFPNFREKFRVSWKKTMQTTAIYAKLE